ncbi:MAG: DUF4040 domain-containing protein [Geitlerinemataceae cyanobacterium]
MNNIDIYVYIIVALLPLAACLVVLQVNPYHALALRGILGAIAALVYAILGAPDVALTEALMGTLLAITLYAVAVRSSLVLRLGILEDGENSSADPNLDELMAELRTIFDKRHMRLDIVRYTDRQALKRALMEKEIHVTFTPQASLEPDDRNPETSETEKQPYHATIRIGRIYEILQTELVSPSTVLNYIDVPDVSVPKLEEKHL